jgi:hypothetical protein
MSQVELKTLIKDQTATFARDDKAIIFMRWIRKYLAECQSE